MRISTTGGRSLALARLALSWPAFAQLAFVWWVMLSVGCGAESPEASAPDDAQGSVTVQQSPAHGSVEPASTGSMNAVSGMLAPSPATAMASSRDAGVSMQPAPAAESVIDMEDAGSAAADAADVDGGMANSLLDSDQVPTLQMLVTQVFQPGCLFGRCHVTAAPAAGLSFTGTRVPVYDMLVSAPTTTVAGRFRVVPGDPEASYLMEKISADKPTSGEPMPPMGRLPPAVIELIRRWITVGAPE